MEAGFSAYVEYVMKNIRWERDFKKRVIGYEETIKAIEKLGTMKKLKDCFFNCLIMNVDLPNVGS